MNIHDLVLAYKQGERLYRGTLSRHFGYEQGGKYLQELVDSELFKEEKLYKCPNCDFPLFSSNQEEAEYYLSQKEMFCYACDTEIKVSELYDEPLLIRTDKPVCSVTIEEDRVERCKGCEHAVVAPLEEAGDPPDLLYCTKMGYPCDMIKLCDVKNTETVNNGMRSLTDKEAEIYDSWLEAESVEVQPVNNWINADEQQPDEDYKEVLVWYEYFRYGEFNCMYQTYGIGYYVKQYEMWFGEDLNGTKVKVLYWQPLPEPPEIKEG